MSSKIDPLKRFVFDGVLAARELQDLSKTIDTKGVELVALSIVSESTDPTWYSPEFVARARTMTRAYFRLYLFENQVRELVERVLREEYGDAWWDKGVSEEIRKEAIRRREAEGTARFHGPRGDGLLHYVSLPDLGSIISKNWALFQGILYRKEWVLAKFEDIRLTRNAIAHMGEISSDDFDRLDVILADWNKQIG